MIKKLVFFRNRVGCWIMEIDPNMIKIGGDLGSICLGLGI